MHIFSGRTKCLECKLCFRISKSTNSELVKRVIFLGYIHMSSSLLHPSLWKDFPPKQWNGLKFNLRTWLTQYLGKDWIKSRMCFIHFYSKAESWIFCFVWGCSPPKREMENMGNMIPTLTGYYWNVHIWSVPPFSTVIHPRLFFLSSPHSVFHPVVISHWPSLECSPSYLYFCFTSIV